MATIQNNTIRCPKDLYSYLSQYIIGQDRAKRILSVAVFNHYQRTGHRISPSIEPELASVQRTQSSPAALKPASPYSPSPRNSPSRHLISTSGDRSSNTKACGTKEYTRSDWDSIGTESSRNRTEDVTIATGAGGADPTLTHDLLTLRSREGHWARYGYFDSRPPALPSLLSKTGKSRKADASFESGASASNEVSAVSSHNFLKGRTQTSSSNVDVKERVKDFPVNGTFNVQAKEDVLIEKSNVLMVGPTGTGKTLMAKTLAGILDVPFTSCDATTYTQAGYVGEDVETCVLRLLQASNFDVDRTEIGIIHIDEVDKLARRGGGEAGSWGSGRDVGGEGVQQALLRLLEGTTLTLSAKPPTTASSTLGPPGSSNTGGRGGSDNSGGPNIPRAENEAAFSDPPGWDPNNPMSRGLGSKKGVREGLPGFNGGGNPGSKGDTFLVDTSNILFVLSGAFVGLETIVNRRLGKGSIGFGAPLFEPTTSEFNQDSSVNPLKDLSTTDLATYGLIPEFVGRLPIISTLNPLSIDDLVRILMEPKNALIKQYMSMFEKYGSELRFTNKAIQEVAREGLQRGGGARGLRGVLEEVLLDSMFEVPASSVRYCLITEAVARKAQPAQYFSRGQRVSFLRAIEEEDGGQVVQAELNAEPEKTASAHSTG
nr:ATP-dependent Clp protease, ATP-binding subunit ClpX [Cryptococcus depauperatus CBS 7841]